VSVFWLLGFVIMVSRFFPLMRELKRLISSSGLGILELELVGGKLFRRLIYGRKVYD